MATKQLSKVQKEAIGDSQSVMSGIKALDKLIGGFQNSNLVVIAARPAMGRRSLALTCAYNQACAGKKVAFFSVSMSEIEIMKRLRNISSLLGNENDEHRFEDHIFINCAPQFEINELRYEAARLKLIENIDIVYIDNLLDICNISTGYYNIATAPVYGEKLRQLSRDINIPIVAVSSLTRHCESSKREDRRPFLPDLRFGNVLNYFADTVMLLHRPEYYGFKIDENGNSLIGVAEVIVEKSPNGNANSTTIHFEQGAFRDVE
ncbi:MAG: DnaB-like helicase C-terminal domain-containing protein [Salinivirgaceae bacterium]|nr:DnaB-like helicase C-terminal domain-containing protein [Salinivirgaceae bacterium]